MQEICRRNKKQEMKVRKLTEERQNTKMPRTVLVHLKQAITYEKVCSIRRYPEICLPHIH